ncbi:UNVERIFIED_ORG: hypothetical protein FHR35_007287 [Microbispora rosea subsp. rosea]
MTTKRWNIGIDITEQDDETYACARLTTADGVDVTGAGHAHRSPDDRSIPEIGDEIATARALARLSHCLNQIAVKKIAPQQHALQEVVEPNLPGEPPE